MADSTAWYDANADTIATRCEGVPPERLHGWLADLLPAAPAAALDVRWTRVAVRLPDNGAGALRHVILNDEAAEGTANS